MNANASAGPVIEVQGLTKRYGGREVVCGLDLTVEAGEVFSLLGPNGAGKTTTVEILEGFRTRSSGEVRVLGSDPAAYRRDWRARIGVVPQSTGAFDDLTVTEVVDHFGGMYPRRLPTGEVIELVGLREKRKATCHTLSGGQKRRLDVALGIVGDPDLIFLDEPTTGLDPEARRQAWELISMLSDRGKTTLLTTHYLDEAEALADRAGIIIGGHLAALGPPAEIGGRESTLTTITFDRSAALRAEPLPSLPVEWENKPAGDYDGGRTVMYSAQPTEAILALIGWARGLGVQEVPGLAVTRPSLEDTYLRLIKEHGDNIEAGAL